MAAEFATGVLLMREIELSNKNISMLLIDVEAKFTKKAIGKISFKCDKGLMIKKKVSSLNYQNKKITMWIDLSRIHIGRCRRIERGRSRGSPYH